MPDISTRSNKAVGSKRLKSRSHRLLLSKLEDRVLFSASPLANSQVDGPVLDIAEDVNFVPQKTESDQIVFIDTSVDDYESLLSGVDSNAKVVLLDANQDGVQQISEELSHRSDIAAIHIISHGSQAELQLGNTTLTAESMLGEHANDLDTIRQAMSDGGDLLIFGCDFGQGAAGTAAASQLAHFTGADVAASNDLTGSSQFGGDWDLEYATGTIETGLVFDASSRGSFVGTLALSESTLNIVSDGTPTFDADNNPGNDTDGANGIIRTHDYISMEVFYNTDAGGATDLHFTSVLPDGLVWDFVPAAAALDSRTMLFDSVTGLEGGDMRGMLAYLPDVSGTFTSSVAFEARALGNAQGTALDDVFFTVDAIENPTSLVTDSFDFVLSSAAHMDLQLLSPTFRGVHKDPTGTIDGVVYSYGIGMLGDHPTRTGSDGVKGTAPIEGPYTFDVDLSAVTPNSQVFTWGPTLGTNAFYAVGGITRNYERFLDGPTERTVWSQSNRPGGQTFEHPTSSAWQLERSTPDSGDFTITSSVGSIYNVEVTGADTSGSHFPERWGGNGVIPASQKWFASGQVHVWIPIDDILPGEDGILGTDDDGVLDVTPELTNFDPDDAYGITNNFGAGTEDTSNNDYTHTVVSFSLGGPTKYNAQAAHPTTGRWVETASVWAAGDGETSVGHQYDARVSSGRNYGILSLSGIIFGDKFDNTSAKLVPNSLPAQSGDGWSRVDCFGRSKLWFVPELWHGIHHRVWHRRSGWRRWRLDRLELGG